MGVPVVMTLYGTSFKPPELLNFTSHMHCKQL